MSLLLSPRASSSQHLKFAGGGKLRQNPAVHSRGDFWRGVLFATGYLSNHFEQAIQSHFLDHKPTRARSQRLKNFIPARVVAKNQHPRFTEFFPQLPNRLDAIKSRHPQIEYHDIRPMSAIRGDRIDSIVRVGDHFHVRFSAGRGDQSHA